MTLPNIVENALSRLKSNRRRNSRNVTAEIRTESLEQRALLTLIGAEVTISNSFQPGDPAVDFSPTPFGSPAFAVVESRAEPEVSQFVDLYDIDLTGNSISLVYNLASNPTVKPAGNFDIYEFEFRGLAPNEFIASATADTSQNLVPDVVVIGNTVRVTVPPNQATGPGQNALINLEIGETSPVSLVGKQVSLSQTQQSNLQTGGVEVPVGSTETATPPAHREMNLGLHLLVNSTSMSIVRRSTWISTVVPIHHGHFQPDHSNVTTLALIWRTTK